MDHYGLKTWVLRKAWLGIKSIGLHLPNDYGPWSFFFEKCRSHGPPLIVPDGTYLLGMYIDTASQYIHKPLLILLYHSRCLAHGPNPITKCLLYVLGTLHFTHRDTQNLPEVGIYHASRSSFQNQVTRCNGSRTKLRTCIPHYFFMSFEGVVPTSGHTWPSLSPFGLTPLSR